MWIEMWKDILIDRKFPTKEKERKKHIKPENEKWKSHFIHFENLIKGKVIGIYIENVQMDSIDMG